jgi:excinuclease UvrABC ATPase subunit
MAAVTTSAAVSSAAGPRVDGPVRPHSSSIVRRGSPRPTNSDILVRLHVGAGVTRQDATQQLRRVYGVSRSEEDRVATTMPDVGPQVREHIEVRGAREHNLRGVDVDIPKRGLTVFTGVSGSGKSSLVFDTIAAESQRLINETYTTFLQSFMATPARPDVDELRNLTAAVVVDQEPMGANARSTVGTATDAYAMLRPLYSRIGTPQVGGAGMFSFNEPQGMCPDCEGLGRAAAIDVDALVDRDRTLREGPIDFPNFQPGSWYWRIFAESGYFDLDTPLRDWGDAPWQRFLHGPGAKIERGRRPGRCASRTPTCTTCVTSPSTSRPVC